jgi:serine protease Do
VGMLSRQGSFKTTFQRTTNEQLTVAVNPRDGDTSARQYSSEAHLRQRESEPTRVSVKEALSRLASEEGLAFSREGLTVEAIASRENREPAAIPTVAQTTALATHPALSSVAVINTLDGIGTGFFVGQHLLLTNEHVVGAADFVEVELFGGGSVTGRVVRRDIDRDLALVEVSSGGTPLELFSGPSLPLGEAVTAIGHPEGLKFTLTRGIISAVREQRSPAGATNLVVQTDTAISPGSSGGPLLLGDKVIGVNTFKRVDVDVEGIGFALHYLEIARFIAAHQASQ